MRFGLLLLLVLSASIATAQFQGNDAFCDHASAVTVNHDSGVIIQELTLRGKWGQNPATVYLPESGLAQAAVVFSHSAIYSDGATTDLLPFAFTLARAGAAVIVPDRTLLRHTNPQQPIRFSTNREPEPVMCASRWLMDNSKLVNQGASVKEENGTIRVWDYVYVGPELCDLNLVCNLFGDTALMPFLSERHKYGYSEILWVPMGEPRSRRQSSEEHEAGDILKRTISDKGLQAAQWIQKKTRLAPITALAPSPKTHEVAQQ